MVWRCALLVVVCGLSTCLTARAAAATDPASALDRALKRYETRDYLGASVLLHEVIAGSAPAGQRVRRRAEWWMVRTMYQLGFYVVALAYLDRIVKQPAHEYRVPALKLLVALAHKLPAPSGVIERIGAYDPVVLKDKQLAPLRDELRYYLGQYHHRRGSFSEAVKLLGAVEASSALFMRARILEGIIHVRTHQSAPALAAFRAALGAAARGGQLGGEQARIADLALLSLARLLYSSGRFKLAAKYYSRLPSTSRYHSDAMLERSWARFRLGDHGGALADLRRARKAGPDPYLESYLLEAVIHHQSCRCRRSLALARGFVTSHGKLPDRLDELLRRFRDPAAMHDQVPKLRAGASGLKGELARIVRAALAERQIDMRLAHSQELAREVQLVRSGPLSWRSQAVASVVLQELTLQSYLVQNEAGQLVQQRLAGLARELRGLLGQARQVEQAAARQVKADKPPASCDKLGGPQ